MKRVPEKDLLADLKRLATELGHTPSSSEYREFGEFGVRTQSERFGSWVEALEAADLEVGPRHQRNTYDLESMDPEDLGLSPMSETRHS